MTTKHCMDMNKYPAPASGRKKILVFPLPALVRPDNTSLPQLGALVINLSPSRLKGLFPGKTGPTKAVHMAFEVARDVSMAPVVIYVDECEQVRLLNRACSS